MSSSSGGDTNPKNLSRIRELINKEGVGGLVITLVGSTMIAVQQGYLNIFNAVITLFVDPVTSFAENLGGIVGALYGGVQDIIGSGATSTQLALMDMGLPAFLVGLGIVMAAMYMVTWYLRQRSTGDTLLGLPIDLGSIPIIGAFVGVTEEGEEDD